MAASVLVAIACADDPSGPPPTTQVVITPSGPVVLRSIGETVQLSAEGRDSRGNPTGASFVWNSDDPSIAAVNAAGVVQSVGVGSTKVTASIGAVSASIQVVVDPAVALVVKVQGDGQSDTVRATLPVPLTVELRDANEHPVPGKIVTFRDGPRIVGVDTTAADGRASHTLVLGDTAGARVIGVYLAGEAEPRVSFSATARPGAPARLKLVGGDGQVGLAGKPLAAPIVVGVTDTYGNALSGAAVSFAATAGGGTLSPTNATTNADGVASAQWTLGAEGIQQEAVITAAAVKDTVVVSASLDPSRIVYLSVPESVGPNDTVSVAITTQMQGVQPEYWGAIVGNLYWDDATLGIVPTYGANPDDYTYAVRVSGQSRVRFVVSRPENNSAGGAVIRFLFTPRPGVAGDTKLLLTLDGLVSAGTFLDLRGQVSVAGASVRIVP